VRRIPKAVWVWAAALVLWAMFALAVTSLADESPTFDEQGFLVRGLAYLRGEANGGSRTIRVGHPLGLNALNAALLAGDPSRPMTHHCTRAASTVRLSFSCGVSATTSAG